MPYVAGESLRARLQREKQLPVDEALQLAREVARTDHGIAFAAAEGFREHLEVAHNAVHPPPLRRVACAGRAATVLRMRTVVMRPTARIDFSRLAESDHNHGFHLGGNLDPA